MNQLNPRIIWLFFLRSFLVGWAIFLALGGFFGIAIFKLGLGKGTVISIIVGIVFLVSLGAYFWARWSYNAYKFELTDGAFKKEYGVIRKRYVSIPYERMQNVNINRGLLMRILGLSSLIIQTAGYGGPRRGYFGFGRGAEGNLPGLSPERAEQLRERLIDETSGGSGV